MKIKVNIHPEKEKFIRKPFDESNYSLLSRKNLTYPIKKHRLNFNCDNYKKGSHEYFLFILHEAVDEILSFIEWDKHTEHNHTEVCGFMVGHHYYDEEKKIYYSEVEKIFTVPTDVSTEVYLQLSTDSMFAIEHQLDVYNDENNSNCRFIGWFHTHPNSLPVFMSSTDLITQTRFFSDDLGYAIVMNPHRLLWKAFRSVNCFDVRCSMVKKNVTKNAEIEEEIITNLLDNETDPTEDKNKELTEE